MMQLEPVVEGFLTEVYKRPAGTEGRWQLLSRVYESQNLTDFYRERLEK